MNDWTWVKCYGWKQHYNEETGHTEIDDDFCEESKYEWRSSRQMDDETLAEEIWDWAQGKIEEDAYDYENQVKTKVLSRIEVESIEHIDADGKPVVFDVDWHKFPSYPDDVE